MKKLADKLADFIVQEGAVPEQAYAVYQYGFQIGLEMLLCFLICLIISIYINMIPESIIFMIIFILLRTYAGGLHMEKFISSEAESLMLRVTRGCHWNKCYFCDLYKKYRFSRRKYEEIEEDLKKAADSEYAQNYTTCFLQDGDAFVLRTEFLIQILEGIHKYLPNIKHVTTYARADSIARKSVSELRELKAAGIEHLYCGMETGSDLILRKINKGFDAATIIIGGTKAKEAGMVLSEFTLFGIGGKELAEENAVETAKVLNVIKPDFIRVHATGIKLSSEMWNYVKNKELTLQSEEEIVSEQKIMLELLADDMDCIYMNEHIVNLLLEVRGNIRTDKQNMLETINTYLQLPKQEQELFNLGRRLNIMFFLADLNNIVVNCNSHFWSFLCFKIIYTKFQIRCYHRIYLKN